MKRSSQHQEWHSCRSAPSRRDLRVPCQGRPADAHRALALGDLRKLDPPAEDRARMNAMTDALGRMVAALDARLEILRAGKNENDAVREHERGHSDLVAAPDCSPTWQPASPCSSTSRAASATPVGDDYRVTMLGTNGLILYPGDAGPGDIEEPRVYVFTGTVRVTFRRGFRRHRARTHRPCAGHLRGAVRRTCSCGASEFRPQRASGAEWVVLLVSMDTGTLG